MKTKFLDKCIWSCLILFSIGFSASAQSNDVTLEGKQFRLNGANFYPRVLNYSVELVYGNVNNTGFFISPEHSYNIGNGFECNNELDCKTNYLQTDFNHIAGMGFNTVRISGIRPHFDLTTNKLFLSASNVNFDTSTHPKLEMNPNSLVPDADRDLLLSYYKEILEVANNTQNDITNQPQPLKVIFVIAGDISSYDFDERTAFEEFIKTLATYISSNLATVNNRNALLAYDLINEPDYHVRPRKTKQEACEMIGKWYKACKDFDPFRLVTVGLFTFEDAFSFDPSIIKMDFASVHGYTDYRKDFEDRSQPNIQQRIRDRTVIKYFWMRENSSVPWIVGETGFPTTNDPDWFAHDMPGDMSTDQVEFAKFTQNAVCSCGGSGYSWWIYQDVHYVDPPNYVDNYYGLLYRDNAPSLAAEKDVVNDGFRNFTPTVGPCPLDYSPLYDASKLYYNPFQHPPSINETITGTIKDQDGNPIKNAVIAGNTDLGTNQSTGKTLSDLHYTFSDENGYFEIIPYDYNSDYSGGGNIIDLFISSAGAERIAFKNSSIAGNPPVPQPNSNPTITLERIKFSYDNVISNITIPYGEIRNLKGYNSLTVSDITVQSGATSDIIARNEVNILKEFSTENGSEVHIFCEETAADCNDYINYSMPIVQKTMYTASQNEMKTREIEVQFKSSISKLKVSPNPSTGFFLVELLNNDLLDINSLDVIDILGRKVLNLSVNAKKVEVDLTIHPKGVYFLNAYTSKGKIISKIVVQ